MKLQVYNPKNCEIGHIIVREENIKEILTYGYGFYISRKKGRGTFVLENRCLKQKYIEDFVFATEEDQELFMTLFKNVPWRRDLE